MMVSCIRLILLMVSLYRPITIMYKDVENINGCDMTMMKGDFGQVYITVCFEFRAKNANMIFCDDKNYNYKNNNVQ